MISVCTGVYAQLSYTLYIYCISWRSDCNLWGLKLSQTKPCRFSPWSIEWWVMTAWKRSNATTASHPHNFTPSQLHTLTPSHPHTLTASQPHTLTTSHPHNFTPSHPHNFTPSQLHTLTTSYPYSLTASHTHSNSIPPSQPHTLPPSQPGNLTPSQPHTLTASHSHSINKGQDMHMISGPFIVRLNPSWSLTRVVKYRSIGMSLPV